MPFSIDRVLDFMKLSTALGLKEGTANFEIAFDKDGDMVTTVHIRGNESAVRWARNQPPYDQLNIPSKIKQRFTFEYGKLVVYVEEEGFTPTQQPLLRDPRQLPDPPSGEPDFASWTVWALTQVEHEFGQRDEGFILFPSNSAAKDFAKENRTPGWSYEGPKAVEVSPVVWERIQREKVVHGPNHLKRPPKGLISESTWNKPQTSGGSK